MGKAEKAGECAAVARDVLLCRDDDARLYRGKVWLRGTQARNQIHKLFAIWGRFRHAAASLLAGVLASPSFWNDTMTDFDVGVSLWSPALPSGTSTFSSG